MKSDRKGPSNARVDYQWRVDRERGFEKTSMIYDAEGKLIGIDYAVPRNAGVPPADAAGVPPAPPVTP